MINGTVDYETDTTTYLSNVTFSCDIGYNLTGPSMVICNSSGQWSDLVTCEINGKLFFYFDIIRLNLRFVTAADPKTYLEMTPLLVLLNIMCVFSLNKRL